MPDDNSNNLRTPLLSNEPPLTYLDLQAQEHLNDAIPDTVFSRLKENLSSKDTLWKLADELQKNKNDKRYLFLANTLERIINSRIKEEIDLYFESIAYALKKLSSVSQESSILTSLLQIIDHHKNQTFVRSFPEYNSQLNKELGIVAFGATLGGLTALPHMPLGGADLPSMTAQTAGKAYSAHSNVNNLKDYLKEESSLWNFLKRNKWYIAGAILFAAVVAVSLFFVPPLGVAIIGYASLGISSALSIHTMKKIYDREKKLNEETFNRLEEHQQEFDRVFPHGDQPSSSKKVLAGLVAPINTEDTENLTYNLAAIRGANNELVLNAQPASNEAKYDISLPPPLTIPTSPTHQPPVISPSSNGSMTPRSPISIFVPSLTNENQAESTTASSPYCASR